MFDYEVVSMVNPDIQEMNIMLHEMGNNKWELVAVITIPFGGGDEIRQFFFKRNK